MRSLCALLMGYKLSSMEIPAGGKKLLDSQKWLKQRHVCGREQQN